MLQALVKGSVPTDRATVIRFCSVVSVPSVGSAPTRPAQSTRLRIHRLIERVATVTSPRREALLGGGLQAGQGGVHVGLVGADAVADAGDELDGRTPVEER